MLAIQILSLFHKSAAQKNDDTLAPQEDRQCEVYNVAAYTDAQCRSINTQFGPYWAGTITSINDLVQSGNCIPIGDNLPKLHARCRSQSSISFTFYEADDANCSKPIPPPGIRQPNNQASFRTFYAPFTAYHEQCYQSTVDYSQYTVDIRNFIKYPGGKEDGSLFFNLTDSEANQLKEVKDAQEIDESVALMLRNEGINEDRRNLIEKMILEFGIDFYRKPEKFGQSFRIQLTAPNGDVTLEELKKITLGIEKGVKLYLQYQRIQGTGGRISDIGKDRQGEFSKYASEGLDKLKSGASAGVIVGIIIAILVIGGVVAFFVIRRRKMLKVPIGSHEIANTSTVAKETDIGAVVPYDNHVSEVTEINDGKSETKRDKPKEDEA